MTSSWPTSTHNNLHIAGLHLQVVMLFIQKNPKALRKFRARLGVILYIWSSHGLLLSLLNWNEKYMSCVYISYSQQKHCLLWKTSGNAETLYSCLEQHHIYFICTIFLIECLKSFYSQGTEWEAAWSSLLTGVKPRQSFLAPNMGLEAFEIMTGLIAALDRIYSCWCCLAINWQAPVLPWGLLALL